MRTDLQGAVAGPRVFRHFLQRTAGRVRWVLSVLGLGAVLVAGQCSAQPALAPTAQEVWLSTGFWSHHTAHRSQYRQQNTGVGLEWVLGTQWQANIGRYANSVYQKSNYAQLGWMPIDWRGAAWRWRAGVSIGVVNGYPKVRHGGYFPAVVPAVSIEAWRMGVNVVYIPSLGTTDGAVAVQAKIKLY